MRKAFILIGLFGWCASLWAANSISIPLNKSVVFFMQQDSPTGSTPDPTDPNQFRATLTGNILTICTQRDEVSYIVIRSDFSEAQGEDYFYALSFDSVSCPITRPGMYGIYIGHWNTDFTATLIVRSIHLYNFSGQVIDSFSGKACMPGQYILRVETDKGNTTTKFRIL